jgi:class 3 adenylate cyclase
VATLKKPETRWAEVDGVRIAYQAFGSGPRTLIGIPGLAQNIETIWDQPVARAFFERMGAICRVVQFDKRGTGLSDRGLPPPALDERARDITAVMEAESVEHAVLAGFSEGATLAVFFAATYPRRVDGLMLSGGCATLVKTSDHPWAPSRRHLIRRAKLGAAVWGQGLVSATIMAPSMAMKPSFWRWARAYERAAMDRRDFVPYSALNAELDIRHILGAVQAPTIVLHARGDRLIPVRSGRFLADNIAGARFIELSTRDHSIWFAAQDPYIDAIEGFLRWRAEDTPDRGRMLATVLFTDIVASTEEVSRLGDSRWVEVLESHDALTRVEVGRFAGRWVKSTGDGILATFDSPAGAIRCAEALRRRVHAELGLRTRAGLHTAEVELRPGDVTGVAVHHASRVQAIAEPMEIAVSAAVRLLTPGSGIRYEYRGWQTLKGIKEPCEIFVVQAN